VNINFKENMEKTANIKIRKIYTDLVVILPKEIFTFNWPRHQTRKIQHAMQPFVFTPFCTFPS